MVIANLAGPASSHMLFQPHLRRKKGGIIASLSKGLPRLLLLRLKALP